ncbi:Cytadherence high molecular weight protein [Actinidia chinensis var. chinensis]|uniref:Cytadherence high molecular weight protein n=1 Tax=Actinidia chinensis var. chinensis TaxID=1590841 RepID=A0A2R6RUN0_ACTCC|nr:Cytadherence high molecular weight protein [Actinidia chinensis var. chinensis]
MAASARAFSLSLFTGLSLNPHQPPIPTPPSSFVHNLIIRPLLPAFSVSRRRSSAGAVCCVVSGVDGGGVSDDFISTRKAGFGSEFSVIANMLKKIEPLDMSVISKGVSDSAKDSMKQTISTMLGLLPSDQFSVTVKVSKRPLDRLLMSSIITGYTLWNAEYRISLIRNFDIPTNDWKSWGFLGENEISEVQRGESKGGASDVDDDHCAEDLQSIILQSLGDLTPEALKYINQLESELSTAKKELNARKHENMQLEYARESNNDLLEYLRSLESEMVTELSRPSSIEVEEIIHQLVQNVLRKFFKDDSSLDFMGDSAAIRSTANLQNDGDECCNTMGTSRDYLAKLLFWCMLLGHHLRGLENRLHLSCVVGLL